MDYRANTKVSILIEKINYLNNAIQSSGGQLSKIDKDLMVGYVMELYETLLGFSTDAQQNYPQQQYPQQQYQQPQQQQMYQPMQQQNYQQLPQQYQQQNFQQQPINPGSDYPPKKENFIRGPSINSSYQENGNRRTVSQMITEMNGTKLSMNDKLKREAVELSDKLKLAPIRDLKTFIGLNKRFAFTTNLFSSNSQDYEKAIDKINGCSTYDEAMSFIQTTLIPKYNWNLDDENFEDLHTFIVRRFMD